MISTLLLNWHHQWSEWTPRATYHPDVQSFCWDDVSLSLAWITINISGLWLVVSLTCDAEARLDGPALVWPPQVAGAESREGTVFGRG